MKDKAALDRRQFLRRSVAGASALAAAATTHVAIGAGAEQEIKPAFWQIENTVDVLVVGGGTAGTVAAIQAGRAGGAGGRKWAQANVGGQLPSDIESTRLFLTLLPAFAPLLTQKECEH